MEGGAIEGDEENILVSVRLRPLNDEEISCGDVSDWECIGDDTIVCKNVSILAGDESTHAAAYTFDRVFGTDCSTREVYEIGAKEVALSVVNGINSTIFAYGQTRSGKTYSLTGITEYAVADIYDYMQSHSERDFVLRFSAMEISCESVTDLLSNYPEKGTTVEALTEEVLRDRNHTNKLLSSLLVQRQKRETSVNEMSTRLHHIIRLKIESSPHEALGNDNVCTLSASLNFVDLPGAEEEEEELLQVLSSGGRLENGCQIDNSLLILLSKEQNSHIPCRDSIVTRILQPSLEGNARTAIICTMSPARSHIEQSRNTLLFASCLRKVSTNAKVNIIISDKTLVRDLQEEVSRLENELRSSETNVATMLREKETQIEKLEEEIKALILHRDIAQSQLKECLDIIGGDTGGSLIQLDFGCYPRFRVQRSPDSDFGEQSSCEHSRSSSIEHFAKVVYGDEFSNSKPGLRALLTSAHSSDIDSTYTSDLEIEKQGSLTSEKAYCIEPEELIFPGASVSNDSCIEESSRLHDEVASPSSPSVKDQRGFMTSLPEKKIEVEEIRMSTSMSTEYGQGSLPTIEKTEEDYISVQYLDIESTSTQPSDDSHPKLSRLRSGIESISTELPSPRLKMTKSTPSLRYEKESQDNLTPGLEKSREKNHSRHENVSDSEFDCKEVDISPAEDSMSGNAQKIDQRSVEDAATDGAEYSKKNLRDGVLGPIKDEFRSLTSWPVEFKRLQREIIQLWHICNVSLAYRSYFFLLFQGDPSDAINMELEMKRMKFLNDKFSAGEKVLVNGKRVTHSSSGKALGQERRMLCAQMLKKLSGKEREAIFVEWGIDLSSKMRRLKLAHLVWSKTDDMQHVTASACLVAKLLGYMESGKVPSKEMFGLNFSPKSSMGVCSFKSSLMSIL